MRLLILSLKGHLVHKSTVMHEDCCVKMDLTQCERKRESVSQLKTSIFLITWRQFSIWIVAVTHIKPPVSGLLQCHHLSPASIWTISQANFMPLASSTILYLSVNVLQITALVWKILMWRIQFSMVSISLWILHLSQKQYCSYTKTRKTCFPVQC